MENQKLKYLGSDISQTHNTHKFINNNPKYFVAQFNFKLLLQYSNTNFNFQPQLQPLNLKPQLRLSLVQLSTSLLLL